jgi:hypothetical protein
VVALPIWVLTRIGFLLTGWFAGLIEANRVYPALRSPSGAHQAVSEFAWPFRLYSRYDAGHFFRIAAHGYYGGPHHSTQAFDIAFFPGYPLAGRAVAYVLGLGHPGPAAYFTALAILAWVGAGIAAVLIWRLAADQFDLCTARWSVLILLVGPYSVFLMASYSEGMFLALGLGAWLAGRSGRWWLAGLLAAGASIVRVNGLFLTAGLLVMFVIQARQTNRRIVRPDLASLALPVLAAGSYLWWLHGRTGSWSSWWTAEKIGWARREVTPWRALTNSWRRTMHIHGAPFIFQDWLEFVFAAILVACVIGLAWHRLWPEFVYVGLTAASLLTSAYYLSIPRSMVVCFPALVVIARALTQLRYRPVAVAVVSLGLAVLAVNTVTLVTSRWTG